MTIPFISPGGSGAPARTLSVPSSVTGFDPAEATRVLRPHFATRKNLEAGVDSLFRPNVRGDFKLQVVLRGWNTSMDHADAVQAVMPAALAEVMRVTGATNVMHSRAAIEQMGAVDTGATLRSIYAQFSRQGDDMVVSVGPTTFYSPLIEFGLAAHMTYGPRPFMSEGYFRTLPQFLQALNELAHVAAGRGGVKTIKEQPYSKTVNPILQRVRAKLYTFEKALGDRVFFGLGNVPGLGKLRSGALGSARILGDLNAVMQKLVGARFVRRLEGKITGRAIGIGSRTIFANRTIVTKITGAERTYNRVAGQYMSRFIGQNRLFGGGF
jgi:hypothetical protein